MSDGKWTVRGSVHVWRDRWVSLRADECVTPSGVVVSPYYVREEPDSVVIFAVDREGRVVLARQYRHGVGLMSLELPGGTMDEGETDPIAVARRELEEETGFRGGTFRRVATLATSPANATNWVHLVLATGVEPGEAHPEPAEDIAVELVTREGAGALAVSGAIINARHVAYLLLGLLQPEVESLPQTSVGGNPR